ncbi:MAG: hypothetical protein CM1200mP25_1920 [Acidobacteriota bacterium]|nr:MAG: hypothetical protein CM1200mP25_1920 [Acidobacteriota bacterium]
MPSRDLLALDDLPKEFDVSTLLPADNATSGFDNLADLLFVSPATLERYLAAARKISQLAVGDTTMPPIVDRYQLDRDLIQDDHLNGLPIGTRGGSLIRSHLPADGEYVVTVEFAQAARAEHEVEVSVDGERVRVFTIGGRELVRGAAGVFAFEAEPPVDVRVPMRAGPREVPWPFCRKPGRNMRALCVPRVEASAEPAIARYQLVGRMVLTVQVIRRAGAYLYVRPIQGAMANACADKIFYDLGTAGVSRASTEADLEILRPFYEEGRSEAGFEEAFSGVWSGFSSVLNFLFRIERDPADLDGGPYTVRIWNWHLGCRFSSGEHSR